jgi:hypothetical protein
MLRHAFETLSPTAIRVDLRTGGNNLHSQAADRQAGRRSARPRSVSTGIVPDGPSADCPPVIRDTVIFSILDDEWPAVKRGLEKPDGLSGGFWPLPRPNSTCARLKYCTASLMFLGRVRDRDVPRFPTPARLGVLSFARVQPVLPPADPADHAITSVCLARRPRRTYRAADDRSEADRLRAAA